MTRIPRKWKKGKMFYYMYSSGIYKNNVFGNLFSRAIFSLKILADSRLLIFVSSSHWTIKMDDDYTCSISTHSVVPSDIGQWNCDLQSFPFADVSIFEG